MAAKIITFDEDARRALERGMDQLAHAMVREGLRNVAAGANPMSLKRGIEQAVESAVEQIKNQAKEIEEKGEIAHVAAISAGDSEIGQQIAEAMDKVGKDGVITVEESQTFGMELELVEGMRFDKGYISPYSRRSCSPASPWW